MMEKQPPKQIYLQAYDSDSYDDNTWCSDKQNEDDIEYILQSEYDQLKSENERLQKYKEKLISDATQNEFVLLAYHDSLKEMKARVQELEMFQDLVNRWSDQYYRDTNKLKQRIAELEQERRWIPTSERNPHSNGLYDVWITGVHNSISAIYRNGEWNMSGVTHWRCKPQPPEDGE